jgi:hypothetical protein
VFPPEGEIFDRIHEAVSMLNSWNEFLEDFSRILECDKDSLEIEISDNMDIVVMYGEEAVAIFDQESGEFLTREELELLGRDPDALEENEPGLNEEDIGDNL